MSKQNGNRKAWDVDMTSCARIIEVNNDMVHNFYYLAKVRVHTGRGTFFRRRFVVWFDTSDLAEWYDSKEFFSQKDIQEYAKQMAWSFVESKLHVPSTLHGGGKCDIASMNGFTESCNETIRRFNGVMAG